MINRSNKLDCYNIQGNLFIADQLRLSIKSICQKDTVNKIVKQLLYLYNIMIWLNKRPKSNLPDILNRRSAIKYKLSIVFCRTSGYRRFLIRKNHIGPCQERRSDLIFPCYYLISNYLFENLNLNTFLARLI